MKLVDTSVRRPVGVIMIVLAILALGIVSLKDLAIDLFPEVDLPIAVVATSYPDAAPQEVENLISQPLEASLSSIEGVETIQSQSQAGNSLIIIMFNAGVNLDNALLEVRENVDSVKGFLPESAEEPSVLRFNPQQMPIMWVGLTGADVAGLQAIADDQIVPYLERQPGVASVSIEGGKTREIQVILDRGKLTQYGVNPQEIVQALQGANISGSAGVVERGDKDLQVRINGAFDSLEDIRQTIIQTKTGARIHIEDVAEVQDTFEASSGIARVNSKPAVVLSIIKQADGNTVEVSKNVKTAIKELETELPSGITSNVIIDTSMFIRSSIRSVLQNMLIGGIFATLVLLLFLKSVRATFVIGLSIPIAIISTFTLLYFTGETLNVLTMGGLALGIGMMVDSSIVILENIVAYRQQGYALKEAAKKGASELAPAVIASTTTTLVVFLPIVFVEGIASSLFTPFALTVSFALIASLAVSVTLIPMLSSKLLTKAMKDNGRRYWFDRLLNRFNNGYRGMLTKALKYRKTTVFATIAAIAGSLVLVPFIGTEFMPQSDQGQIDISVEPPTGTSFEEKLALTDEVNERLAVYADVVETSYVSIGSSSLTGPGGNDGNASYTIQLVSSAERTKTTDQIIQDIQADVKDIPGAEITVSAIGAGLSGEDPIQVQLKGPNYDVLAELSEQVVWAISNVEGIHNPSSSVSDSQPELNVIVDREMAAQYGLTYQQVMSQIQLGFTGQVAMSYRENGEEMNVRLTFPEDEQKTISDLENTLIQAPTGAAVPLAAIADFEQFQGPATLLRENQQPQVNVTSEIIGRDLGSINKDVKAALDAIHFPDQYAYSMGGEVEDMREAFSDLALALIFSIFLVYAVMAVQFENFLTPFVIMFSLPATVVGILLGLFVTGKPFSVTAFIGIIMLAGIVVNNAIVLVDYINILRSRGMTRFEAILEAGTSRMRPILMTTLTTILGMVPLALGFGEGAETQQPLAITIIFGLGISSIFTLLLIPVVYTYFDGLSGKVAGFLRRERKAKKA